MKKPLLLSVVTSLVITLAVGIPMGSRGLGTGSVEAKHQAGGGTIALLAIDMDITGNTIDPPVSDAERASLGPIESCKQISTGETATIDIVVQGYPADHPLVGYGVSLVYDPAIVKVVDGANTFDGSDGRVQPDLRTLISADPQSGSFAAFTNFPPDSDGYFFINVADFAPRQAEFDPDGLDESVDGEETIDGFLARITLEAVGPGTSNLTIGPGTAFLAPTVLTDFDLGEEIPIDNINADLFTGAVTDPPAEGQIGPDGTLDSIQGAAISVDEPCAAPPTPPPSEGDAGSGDSGQDLAEDLDPTKTEVNVPDASPFSVGDLIRVDDELMEITDIAGNTLTVIRGVRGTTASTHASGTDVLAAADTGAADGAPTGTTPEGPPAGGGPPGEGEAGGDGGPGPAGWTWGSESDGGLGVAGWTAIGVGLGAAALAALGAAAWYVIRRRRQQT